MTQDEALLYVLGCTYRGGPEVTQYANLSAAFTVLEKCQDPMLAKQIEWMIQGIANYQLESRDCKYYNAIPHIYQRPYGHAGDFALLAKMYDMHDKLTKRLPSPYTFSKWDLYVASLPSTQSVFNRESHLLEQIGSCIEQRGSTSVLDLACGDGRLMKLVKRHYPKVDVTGIDLEPLAIKAADTGTVPARFLELNALKELPYGQYDIVVSGGLCDYLTDQMFERLIRRIERTYHPQLIILGNLDHHECEPLMSLLGWDLIYRSAFDLIQIGLRVMCWKDYVVTVRAEPLGINLFLTMERTT